MISQRTFLFLTYLLFVTMNYGYYQKDVNQIILNRITLKSLPLRYSTPNFVDYESFLETLLSSNKLLQKVNNF